MAIRTLIDRRSARTGLLPSQELTGVDAPHPPHMPAKAGIQTDGDDGLSPSQELTRTGVDRPRKGVSTLTFGCRLNAYESDIAEQAARKAGRDNLLIVNTCAVTAEAVRQARQAIRKAHRDHPDRPIAVTGCAAQIDPDTFRAMKGGTEVIGNAEKLSREAWRKGSNRPAFTDIMHHRGPVVGAGGAMQARTRAHLAIQNGCDHRCTFCIIP